MSKFEQIVCHAQQYGPENEIDGVLNFLPEEIQSYFTPPKKHWSENTKSTFTYLRLKGHSNPKPYLVKYDDLVKILKKHSLIVDEQK